MEKPRLDGVLHVSDTRRGVNYIIGKVVRLESFCEILFNLVNVNILEVIMDRNHFGFLLQITDGS